MLIRSNKNPILSAQSQLIWCSKKVYNAAVCKDGEHYEMLLRAVGNDWVSRIGRARSINGVDFAVQHTPAISPVYPWEEKGCEDPRITKIGDMYFVAYTAFDGTTARAALTTSKDLAHWGERRLLFPDHTHDQREDLPGDWSKAAALFPEIVDGQYWLFYGDNHIWPAVSDDLITWRPSKTPILSARQGFFDAAYVEMGPPPMRTAHGWLVLYHGIDEISENRTYSLGAVLLDIDNPLKVLWRSNTSILTPTEKYETVGLIDIVAGGFATLQHLSFHGLMELAEQKRLPKAIFCCGAVLEGDNVRIYYGAADTVICTATIDLESLLKS